MLRDRQGSKKALGTPGSNLSHFSFWVGQKLTLFPRETLVYKQCPCHNPLQILETDKAFNKLAAENPWGLSHNSEARKRGRGNIEIQAVCIYSLQDHSQMFNLSLDLNQHLDPCCLQFFEETFKNSPFSYNMLCQSHRRNSGGDVWVSQTSLPQHSFSVFCSVYVDVKAVLIYMLWIYCPVITFKDGLGKSAQFTGGRIMARRATRGH